MSTGFIFRFGPFELDPAQRVLTHGSSTIALGPKVVETLTVLVDHAGVLVTKSELMDRVWPNRCVEEANLTQNFYRLRRVLTAAGLDDAIQTLACRGYKFSATVERIARPDRSPAVTTAGRAATRRPHLWIIAATTAACVALLLATGLTRTHSPTAYARL